MVRRVTFEDLEPRCLLALTPMLLGDLNPGGDSFPSEFKGAGGITYFAANGDELWKTNGTSAGTVLIKEIDTVTPGTHIGDLHSHNGTLVFEHLDFGSDGIQFTGDDRLQWWKSDGTTAGTMLIKDFGLGSHSSTFGSYFTTIGGTLYGVANGGDNHGTELWKSDLTSGGTTLVKDIQGGSIGSYPYELVNFGGQLYFSAKTNTNGRELWTSDGTSAGTTIVHDIVPGPVGSYPAEPTVSGGQLFFTALDPGADSTPLTADDSGQLWKSDGTSAGTELVKDFGLGSATQEDSYLTDVNGTLYGVVTTSASGREVWKSDGSSSGTQLLKDIRPGSDSSYPTSLTNVNGVLYFGASDGSLGTALWKSDGTSAGTVIVKEFGGGGLCSSSQAYPAEITSANGTVYFAVCTAASGTELWQSDGTSAGTTMVAELNLAGDAQIRHLAYVNGKLYFAGDDGNVGLEPYVLASIGAPTSQIGFHRSNRFYQDVNGNGQWDNFSGGDRFFTFGAPGDTPLVGDWDGDGDDDIGFHRDNRFYLDLNGNGQWDNVTGGDVIYTFGAPGDTPIIGDWDGDGVDQIGFHRDNRFYLDLNGNGRWNNFAGGDIWVAFGAAGDRPVIGDWNGDLIDDLGFHRGNRFYLDLNGNRTWNNFAGGDGWFAFGAPGDTPLAGDWDGDGDDDIGFHRGNRFYLDANANRTWNGTAGGDVIYTFGAPGDTPLIGVWTSVLAAAGASSNFAFSALLPVEDGAALESSGTAPNAAGTAPSSESYRLQAGQPAGADADSPSEEVSRSDEKSEDDLVLSGLDPSAVDEVFSSV